MSIAEMQACLARLYIDDSFRNLFYIDTAAAVQEYLLTEAESAAISKINRRMLDFFAESLKRKRKEKLQRAYPALFALERAEIDRYYRRYYQLYTANPHQNNLQDVSYFGIFMEETLARAEALPPSTTHSSKYQPLYNSILFTPTTHII